MDLDGADGGSAVVVVEVLVVVVWPGVYGSVVVAAAVRVWWWCAGVAGCPASSRDLATMPPEPRTSIRMVGLTERM